MTNPLRAALLNALNTNAYRGAWSSDRATMMPMRWDADSMASAPPSPPIPPDRRSLQQRLILCKLHDQLG